MSLAESENRDPFWTVGTFCALRHKGAYSDEQIAEKLRFDSTEDMHIQLRNWGMPSWLVYGAPPQSKETAERSQQLREDRRTPKRAGGRKAKKFGRKESLPAAERAMPLFKFTLSMLDKELDKLRGRKEYLQGGRFVGVREMGGKRQVLGAKQAPPPPLTALIAIEALVRGSVTSPFMISLLDALHPSELIEEHKSFKGGTLTERRPDPTKIDLGQLQNQIDGLRKHAENVAKLIRGLGKIEPGRPPAPLSTREHAAYPLIKQREREGVPDEEIKEEVNRRLDRDPLLEARSPGAEDFTLEEIRYLKSLDF